MTRTALLLSILLLSSPTPAISASSTDTQLKESIKEVLKDNPELIIEALGGKEEELYDLLQIGLEKKKKSKIRAGRLKQLRNPKIAALHPERPIWGNPDGDISIIVFSDFQSATCSKADSIIQELLRTHPNVSYRYRHNPLGLHKMSLPAAYYYEAAALQSHSKAQKFNHLILKNRLKIKKGEAEELDRLAVECGLDMPRLHKDIKSDRVKKTVADDRSEAKKLGFTASPVFLVNGVTVTGAAPLQEFDEVIQMVRTTPSK